MTPVDPERMGRNGQLAMEGAAALGASGGADLPQRRQLRAVQLLPVRLPRSTPSAGCTSPTCRARSRPGRGCAPTSRSHRIIVEDGRAAGVECLAGAPGERNGSRRRYTVRARRGDRRRRRARNPGAAAALGARRRRRWGATSTSTPPAGSAPATRRRCAAGRASCRATTSTSGSRSRSCSRRPSPRSPSAAPGCSAPGASTRGRCSASTRIGSIGVHLSDRSRGRVGLAGDGTLRATYALSGEDARRLIFGIARAAEVHFAAGATRGLSQHRPASPCCGPAIWPSFEARRFRPAELRLEAFHPMGTARIAADPGEGACGADGAVHGVEGLHVADASLFPTSVGVNPMMTVIAFSKRVAAAVASPAGGSAAPPRPTGVLRDPRRPSRTATPRRSTSDAARAR